MRTVVAVVLLIGCGASAPARTAAESAAPEPSGDGWTCSTTTSDCSSTSAGCTGPCRRMGAVWCFQPGGATTSPYLSVDPPAPEVCLIAASACTARRTSADSACREVNLTPDESRRAFQEGLFANTTVVTIRTYSCFAFDDTRSKERHALCYPTSQCESERAEAERTVGRTGAATNYGACESVASVWCFPTGETGYCTPTREACDVMQRLVYVGAGGPATQCTEQR